MTLFSLVAALLIEQLQPLSKGNFLFSQIARYARYLERHFNAGEMRQGVVAWALVVLPPSLFVIAVYLLLFTLNPLLGWLWNVLILYVTMGFRQFSHYFSGITNALAGKDVADARTILSQWTGQQTEEFESRDIARVSIEQALIYSYKHVFGVVFWFALLPGPVGALLYRMAALLARQWSGQVELEAGQFGVFAQRVHAWMDWLPVRLAALTFAVVGNFEDAVYCWQNQAKTWTNRAQGILLASGAGAIGVRLGEPLRHGGELEYRPELGIGDEADGDYLKSAVGLIWRSLVLWLLVVFLMSFANWLG